MLITFVLVYLLITLIIGGLASRKVKNTADFALAGRNMPLAIAGSALFATWFGSETLMGASSEFVENGLIGVIEDPFGASLCLVLVGAFFARPLYKLNILTLNDFFRLRFGRRAEFISALLMVPSFFSWIAGQIVAMAFVLSLLLEEYNVGFYHGVVICTIIVVFYTYTGGMWAVSITDFIQTFMIVAGMIFLTIVFLQQAGGWQKVASQQPEGFFRFFPEGNWRSVTHYIAAWLTLGLGSIPGQDIFQRVMSAKNENTAVRSAYLGGFLYISIGVLPLIIGLCGKVMHPELQGLDSQTILPKMVLDYSGIWIKVLFFGALISAILSTASGAILAPATVIAENLIRPTFGHLTDTQLLKIMRLSVIVVATISAGLACLSSNIYELVGLSSSFTLVSLFAPLAAGIYWKKTSRFGAILSMLVGMTVWIFCEILQTETPAGLIGLAASIISLIAGVYLRPDNSYEVFSSLQKKQ